MSPHVPSEQSCVPSDPLRKFNVPPKALRAECFPSDPLGQFSVPSHTIRAELCPLTPPQDFQCPLMRPWSRAVSPQTPTGGPESPHTPLE